MGGDNLHVFVLNTSFNMSPVVDFEEPRTKDSRDEEANIVVAFVQLTTASHSQTFPGRDTGGISLR